MKLEMPVPINAPEQIQKALDFIETRLTRPVSLEEVAEVACYSKFHLIKVFQKVCGETVMDYLRKRRISQAATELVAQDVSILDVAFKYQFESQEAFTRSFQQVFGMPPGKFRKLGHRHVDFERYTLSPEDLLFLTNYSPMEPRIVDIEPRLLTGKHVTTCLADNQIPGLWKSFMPRRHEIKNRLNELHYAVHHNDPDLKITDFNPNTKYESWATVEVSDHEQIPEGMEGRILEGGKYAVFIHKGPAASFRKTFQFIHFEWLPNSEYELDSRDHFEILDERYLGPSHPDSEEEVWIPVRLKK